MEQKRKLIYSVFQMSEFEHIDDIFIRNAVKTFEEERKGQKPESKENYHQWNGTSVSLTMAAYEATKDDYKHRALNEYIHNRMVHFLEWYESCWPNRPVYMDQTAIPRMYKAVNRTMPNGLQLLGRKLLSVTGF